MKVVLLLADCNANYLVRSVETVVKVLQELDVEIHKVDLYKLPYFTGIKNREMELIMSAIRESKGVIAITSVPMLSIHGAMQSFFDTATLYDAKDFNKPILTITYSEWLGEVEAAERMLKVWNILGGTEGGKVCFNKQVPLSEIAARLEKEVEDMYRLLKQDRTNIGCSERAIYRCIKDGVIFDGNTTSYSVSQEKEQIEKQPEIKSFASMLRAESINKTNEQELNVYEAPKKQEISMTKQKENRIDLSTKEQTIKEISNLLKKEVDDEFVSLNSGIYRRPGQVENIKNKKIQQLPHYFIAQHDKGLKAILKYQITDLNEEGYIVIENGDCTYEEIVAGMPTVELVLTDEVFKEIQSKRMTYQKAFMLGKLKVKGNFAILPKLDQVFKSH